jgi:hypothetical protein
MKGFALILAFLALEAAFLWHVAAPRGVASLRATVPFVAREALGTRGARAVAPAAAPSAEVAPCPDRTSALEERRAERLPGVSL